MWLEEIRRKVEGSQVGGYLRKKGDDASVGRNNCLVEWVVLMGQCNYGFLKECSGLVDLQTYLLPAKYCFGSKLLF